MLLHSAVYQLVDVNSFSLIVHVMQANFLDRFAVFSIPPKIVVLVYNRCTLGSRTIVIGYICFLLQCCPTFGIFLEHLNGYPNQALRHVIVFN